MIKKIIGLVLNTICVVVIVAVAAFIFSPGLFGLDIHDNASIGIIGGSDGPTAIFVTSKLSEDFLIEWVGLLRVLFISAVAYSMVYFVMQLRVKNDD